MTDMFNGLLSVTEGIDNHVAYGYVNVYTQSAQQDVPLFIGSG